VTLGQEGDGYLETFDLGPDVGEAPVEPGEIYLPRLDLNGG